MSGALEWGGPLRRRRWPRRLLLLVLTASALALLVAWQDTLVELAEFRRGDVSAGRVNGVFKLADYRAAVQGLNIPGIGHDLSGITHDPERGRLLAITNAGPTHVLALDRQGRLLGRYPLIGFEDPEDLAWLGDDLLLIIEERVQRLNIIRLPAAFGSITRDDARQLTLGVALSDDNKGFEGVAYDRHRDVLYVVKERDPQQLYRITGLRPTLAGNLQLDIQDLSHWVENAGVSTDLSAITVEPDSGHLLLLSDESQLLFELGNDGQLLDRRSLRAGNGMREDIPQPEGVVLGERGELFVVSEPNLFYRFARPARAD
ncbi:MAG: SdiA-regulated domain-containing protein [Pseudomonadaceae bacterium]